MCTNGTLRFSIGFDGIVGAHLWIQVRAWVGEFSWMTCRLLYYCSQSWFSLWGWPSWPFIWSNRSESLEPVCWHKRSFRVPSLALEWWMNRSLINRALRPSLISIVVRVATTTSNDNNKPTSQLTSSDCNAIYRASGGFRATFQVAQGLDLVTRLERSWGLCENLGSPSFHFTYHIGGFRIKFPPDDSFHVLPVGIRILLRSNYIEP